MKVIRIKGANFAYKWTRIKTSGIIKSAKAGQNGIDMSTSFQEIALYDVSNVDRVYISGSVVIASNIGNILSGNMPASSEFPVPFDSADSSMAATFMQNHNMALVRRLYPSSDFGGYENGDVTSNVEVNCADATILAITYEKAKTNPDSDIFVTFAPHSNQ